MARDRSHLSALIARNACFVAALSVAFNLLEARSLVPPGGVQLQRVTSRGNTGAASCRKSEIHSFASVWSPAVPPCNS